MKSAKSNKVMRSQSANGKGRVAVNVGGKRRRIDDTRKKKVEPKYEILTFEPLPRKGANLATEFMRIGKSVGGVRLKWPRGY